MIRLTPAEFDAHQKRLAKLKVSSNVRTHRMRDEEVNPAKTPALPVPRPASRKASRHTPSHTMLVHIEFAGLPAPNLEYRFDPVRKWRFDMVWLDRMLACEIDGGTWVGGRHTRGPGYEKDCEKLNAAVLAGYRVFRFTTRQVESGYAVDLLGRVLKRG